MSERPPIVVLGANHAGTRLLVDILRILGSNAGRIDNAWLEDETFLEIHRRLIGRVSQKSWTETIFDMEFVRSYRDDGRWVPNIHTWLTQGLDDSFPQRRTSAWHWKCPTAVMFLRSWLEIYPSALFIHLERDPEAVARSLVRRRQFLRFGEAAEFYDAMNQRVLDARPRMKNYLRLSYESLSDNLPLLAQRAGLRINEPVMDCARGAILHQRAPLWRPDRSVGGNLWEILTNARAAVRSRNGKR
jgi:hypothetical protein